MRRSLRLAVVLVLLGVGSAAADIRIDPPEPSDKAPSPPPATEPRGSGGCGRDNGAEWLVATGVLALGLAGMRRYRGDRAAA